MEAEINGTCKRDLKELANRNGIVTDYLNSKDLRTDLIALFEMILLLILWAYPLVMPLRLG